MMNVISIMGRLVKDPEYSETHTGTEKATFCVAVDRDYKAQNEERAKTDFINCIAWGSTAGFIEKYFRKGQMCGVSGRLEINNYKDDNGQNRSYTQVKVDHIYFGGSKKDNEAAAQANGESYPAVQESAFAVLEDDDSDLPF